MPLANSPPVTSKFTPPLPPSDLEHLLEETECLWKDARGRRILVTRDRSLLCVGVPYERYGLGFAGKGTLYRGYLNALLHFPAAMVAVDFYSTIARVRLGGIPPLGLIKCHEHLNFFDERSMKALLERMGFAVIDSRIESVVKYPARVESLQILARRS